MSKPSIDELRELLSESWCNPLHHDFDPNDGRWSTLPSDVRLQFMRAAQDLAVMERGYTCVGVFPTEEGDHHFGYTVGEEVSILVTGISSQAQGLLDVAHGLMPRDCGVVVDMDGFGAVFAPVPDDEFRQHCTMAIAVGATSAVQFIWTDDERRWPWDDGHLALIHPGSMPILAGADWRPTS